jgi:bis(5'-nucleosyl)-tetraphosphatase (symmetrical)
MKQTPEKQNIWAIGDVQGCYDSLQALLDKINFSPLVDGLWMVGDWVNRGPKSFEVLSFCKDHATVIDGVLGNHDLHLLGCMAGVRKPAQSDTLSMILRSSQKEDLGSWLRQQPFYRVSDAYMLIHAGLPMNMPLADFMAQLDLAHEQLRSSKWESCLNEIFLGTSKMAQCVAIATRIRMIDENEQPNWSYKGAPSDAPENLTPWFRHPAVQLPRGRRVVFGHWAALGLFQNDDVVALDTGCVWRRSLSAFNIKTNQIVQVERVHP